MLAFSKTKEKGKKKRRKGQEGPVLGLKSIVKFKRVHNTRLMSRFLAPNEQKWSHCDTDRRQFFVVVEVVIG